MSLSSGMLGEKRYLHKYDLGKPCRNRYYEEYKAVYQKVLKEFGREDMPVLYNVNFGHCPPIGIIPYGILCEMDATVRTIKLCESCVL